jgi:aryl-alcohol dehydrogenase-like predicted oxidoreductase
MPEVFNVLDDLVKAGKVRYYGVSVEKVEEALKAIEYPNVQSVQIVFNIFRQRPLDLFFKEAQRCKVGILMSPVVTCAIPGAKRPSQVEENVRAADLPPLSSKTMTRIDEIYERLVRPHVHHYW